MEFKKIGQAGLNEFMIKVRANHLEQAGVTSDNPAGVFPDHRQENLMLGSMCNSQIKPNCPQHPTLYSFNDVHGMRFLLVVTPVKDDDDEKTLFLVTNEHEEDEDEIHGKFYTMLINGRSLNTCEFYILLGNYHWDLGEDYNTTLSLYGLSDCIREPVGELCSIWADSNFLSINPVSLYSRERQPCGYLLDSEGNKAVFTLDEAASEIERLNNSDYTLKANETTRPRYFTTT